MSGYRRQPPIRDAIRAFLSEPRSARAIADHIDHPVPKATGPLAAVRRRGMVLRLGFAAYARADYVGPPLHSIGREKPTSSDRQIEMPAR